MNDIIEVKNLSYNYSKQKILEDINLLIKKQDFVVIIGENGTGKSTILKLILNELALQDGQIKLFEQDINNFKQWPKIGYIAQDSTLLAKGFPASVQEIVKANLYSKIGRFKFANKNQIEQTLDALKLVDMQKYSNSLINELSGGQQQRIMLARVLVSNPQLMILDEPTNAIDAQSKKSLYDLLKKLNTEEKLTILMITHDIEFLVDYANKFLYLNDGKLVELTKDQVKQQSFNGFIVKDGEL